MGRLVDLNDAKALIEDIYKRDKDTINMSYGFSKQKSEAYKKSISGTYFRIKRI